MYPWLRRQRWMPWVAAVVSIYVLVLLVHAHRSQDQLRAAAQARVLADTRQLAAVLGDVLAEQRQFASELARSHELEVFLVNKGLGMSMRYGLNANLFDIEEGFRRLMDEKKALGVPIYQRVLYLDEQGVPTADTAPGLPLPPFAPAEGPAPGLLIDQRQGLVVAAAPVGLRGMAQGTLITVAASALLSRHLTAATADLGFRQLLVTDAGLELPPPAGASVLQGISPAALTRLPAEQLTLLSRLSTSGVAQGAGGQVGLPIDDGDPVFGLRIPVAGAALSLVTLLPESMLYGHIASRVFLYAASAVPFVFLLAALWIDRMHRRTRRLEADVLASNRSRAELKDRNDALTVEIARREALEHDLRESEERYRTYIEHAPEGIFVADQGGRFVDVNPSACAMVGFDRAELLAMTVTDLSPPGLSSQHSLMLDHVQRHGQLEAEVALQRKNGRPLVAILRAIGLPDGLVMGFCVDVTERKQAEEQIRSLAFFDPLTSLPNRRLLMDRLRRAMTGSQRSREFGALLILDLDHFKDLNDTQGHDVGDRLLVDVARRLTATVRHEDTVSRFGGDEYVVVAEGLGADESAAALRAESIAEKIHQALGLPYTLADARPAHHSTPSIGVTLFRGEDTAPDTLLKQADVALYQAKDAGRNAIRFFNPQMQAAIDARAQMESTLRQAIDRNELKLFFQPQLDRQGQIIGAEALLRWFPAGRAPVSPMQFIPLAEETGLIVPIGNWVLEQACAQLRRWQSDPRTRSLTLSVNVSARQFHQPDFFEQVCRCIEQARVDPTRLTLELTESVVLDRIEEVIERMQRLKSHGLRFSLDDFGTGYSSLSYLKRLPLDEVKIDKSFVRDITHDQNDAAIVRAVLAMSRTLGLSVVAEGVETEAQRAFLHHHGCDCYQGYLFGKPAPIEEWPEAAALATAMAG